MRQSIKRLAAAYPRYLVVAVAIFVVLTVSGCTAPLWPSWLFVPFCIVYAVLATIGSLYGLVVRRMHRQYKLNEDGALSDLNRKWLVSTIVLFVVGLVSALAFVLSAPGWGILTWVLVWALALAYYWCFCAARAYVSQQYAPRFQKAATMQWGFGILMVVVCLVYAAITLATQSSDTMSLAATLLEGDRPFAQSPAPLLGEIDKLAFFSGTIVEYGRAQIGDISSVALFLIDAVSFAFVLFGLINLLNFCILEPVERRSVYRLLPVDGELDASQPVMRRYLVAVVVTSVVFAGAYAIADNVVANVRETEEYTQVDAFLQERIQQVSVIERYTQLSKLRDEQLVPLIDEYYALCGDNLSRYVDWYDRPFGGGAANFAQGFFDMGRNAARDAFAKNVADYGDAAELLTRIQSIYRENDFTVLTTLVSVQDAVSAGVAGDAAEAVSSLQGAGASTLELWAPLQSAEGIDEYLFVSDDDVAAAADGEGSEAVDKEVVLLAQLQALVVASRVDALATLGID